MKNVIIRYCKVWVHNSLHAARVAKFMKSKSGIVAQIDSGGKIGEFTVWVDDKKVEKKGFLKIPNKENILAAVQKELN